MLTCVRTYALTYAHTYICFRMWDFWLQLLVRFLHSQCCNTYKHTLVRGKSAEIVHWWKRTSRPPNLMFLIPAFVLLPIAHRSRPSSWKAIWFTAWSWFETPRLVTTGYTVLSGELGITYDICTAHSNHFVFKSNNHVFLEFLTQ